MIRKKLLGFAVVLMALQGAGPAWAETFTVTSDKASGPGSLRWAIRDANANGNPAETDMVEFAPGISYIRQDDLDETGGLNGSLEITESLRIVGPGRDALTIDGWNRWISESGVWNGGFPDDPGVIVAAGGGVLFVIPPEASKVEFTLEKLTVFQSAGVLKDDGSGTNKVTMRDVFLERNSYTIAGSQAKASLINIVGELRVEDSLFFGNKSTAPMVSCRGTCVVAATTMFGNEFKATGTGQRLGLLFSSAEDDDFAEVIDSQISDNRVIHDFLADTYLTNSVFRRSPGPVRQPLVRIGKAGGAEAFLTNVTVYSESFEDPVGLGQPSHLWLTAVNAHIYNTVVANEDGTSQSDDVDMVQLDNATIENSSNNWVSDGSGIPGAGSGDAGLERPLLDPTSFKPVAGSLLIDAGDSDKAVDPRTNVDLLQDVLGDLRVSGTLVDIGAVEVQEGFAVNDLYTTLEGTELDVAAPGVVLNDIFPTLLSVVFKGEGGECDPNCRTDHGTLTPARSGGQNSTDGGFQYIPDPGFIGVDRFRYFLAISAGLSNEATAVIEMKPKDGAPDCSSAQPDVTTIWAPDHRFVPVKVNGITDPDGDSITVSISSIFQDEPVNGTSDGNTDPDAYIDGDTAWVRAERAGSPHVPGDGRFYHVSFVADDGKGASCSGTVRVSVPHDMHHSLADEGPLYDSTAAATP